MLKNLDGIKIPLSLFTTVCNMFVPIEFIGHNHWTNRLVEVGNEERMFTECGDLGDDNNALQVDVVCPQSLVGRYVRVRASQYDANLELPRLYMCEVFVIGYQFESR